MRQMEDTLKKQKLSSMLDPITTERIYGNQMPYLFSDKNYNFNTHGKFILVDQIRHIDIDEKKGKTKTKKKLLDINTRNSTA